MANIPSALRLIDEFAGSPTPGKWPHIDKTALIADMRDRVQNPEHVNQQKSPLCGPCAAIFELLRREPGRYVSLVRQLFEKGAFRGRTRLIQASGDLMTGR